MKKSDFEQLMHNFYNDWGDEICEATDDEVLQAFRLYCLKGQDGPFEILEPYV